MLYCALKHIVIWQISNKRKRRENYEELKKKSRNNVNCISNYYNDYYCVFLNAATNEGCNIELTGTCSILQDIVKNTNRDNITLL